MKERILSVVGVATPYVASAGVLAACVTFRAAVAKQLYSLLDLPEQGILCPEYLGSSLLIDSVLSVMTIASVTQISFVLTFR